jgi:hypothetical protein
MHKYRVLEVWHEEKRVVVRCSRGRYHLARVLNAMPETQHTLVGDAPHLGFGLMQGLESGMLFRMIFESINEPDLTTGRAADRHPPYRVAVQGLATKQATGWAGTLLAG